MSIVAQQAGIAATNTNAGGSTVNLSITPLVAGSLLVVCGAMMDANTLLSSVASVSDNVDGAWTVVQANSGPGTQSNVQNSFIAYRICSSTAARTITITFQGATSYYSVCQPSEFSGIDSTNPVDCQNVSVTNATGTSIGTALTTSAYDALVIAVGSNLSGSAWSSPTTGWTNLFSQATSGSSQDGLAVYQIAAAPGTFAPTFTETSGSWYPTATIVAFRGAGTTLLDRKQTGRSSSPPRRGKGGGGLNWGVNLLDWF